MSGHNVKLYIYELSRGLARQMSPLLLGKQIDGIWHTGVVCFGREFFFGGGGIENCSPGGTILGMPDEVANLGETHITEDIFVEYLRGLGMEEFRPDKYHLFEHNCNTFSNEVAMFLTGHKIPRHIQDLPKDVLNSAFGQMIKPLVDSMQVTPAGGTSVGGNTGPPTTSRTSADRVPASASATGSESCHDPESIFEPRGNFSNERSPTTKIETNRAIPPPAVFAVEDISTSFMQLKDELSKDGHKLEELDVRTLDELSNMLSKKNPTVKITEEHIKYIESKFQQCIHGEEHSFKSLLEIVQGLCLENDFIELPSAGKFLWKLVSEFSTRSSRQGEIYTLCVKTLCNAVSSEVGHKLLLSNDPPPPYLSAVVACSLLDEHSGSKAAGAALAFNMARYKVEEDIALESSSAIIEVLRNDIPSEMAYHCLFALQQFMHCSSELRDLANVMGVDVSRYQGQSGEIDELCKELKSLMLS